MFSDKESRELSFIIDEVSRQIEYVLEAEGAVHPADRMNAVKHLCARNILVGIAKNDSHWEVRETAFEKITEPEDLKQVVEKYFAELNALEEYNEKEVRQKIRALIAVAKKYPELLKENWKQINERIKTLYDDYESGYCLADDWGLVFPPYPFED
jgi:archaellum component FlaC